MKVEEIIKSNSYIGTEKKTVLNLLYTQNVISDKINDALKDYGLSTEQFNVLRILRGQNGKPINMSAIQERMIAKTSNTTRLVDKLLIKELVERKICKSNRRKIEINITQKGLELLLIIDPQIESHESKFASNLTIEELELFNQLLEKYRTLR